MKQNKLFLGLATMFAAAFTFTACSSDDAESRKVEQTGQKINFVYKSGGTRTVTDPQSSTSVATGLNVGIFGVSSEASTTMTNYTNNKYVTASAGAINLAEGSSAMTWPTTAEATASIYAYAPYNNAWTVNAANAFSVQADQSTDANYLASDLLYASATNQAQNTNVALAFSHKLSKVNITIKKATGSNVTLNGATVKIKSTKLTTSLNPTTGALGDASGDATDITAATIASELTPGDDNSTATACAVIVPQALAASAAFVEITTTDSKTLIGKLSEETTFASGQSYSMTVSVGNVTETVTEVPISLGTTSLVAWTNNNIGLTAYGVGDYVLTDGTFMKASAYSTASSADKAKVAGIIFSTTVSSTDAAAGYNAYAMGLNRQKQAFHASVSYPSQMVTDNKINDLADAIADLDGLTRTTTMLTSSYYTSLTDDQKAASMINLSWYSTTKSKAISANASAWYLPSFGQIVQILNNLGGANFTTYDFGEGSFTSSSTYTVGDATALTTMAGNIQAYVTTVGGQADMFTAGNINYPSSTENGSNSESHYGKVFSINFTSSSGWNFGKALGRTDASNYSVIPVVAVKLPAVAE